MIRRIFKKSHEAIRKASGILSERSRVSLNRGSIAIFLKNVTIMMRLKIFIQESFSLFLIPLRFYNYNIKMRVRSI